MGPNNLRNGRKLQRAPDSAKRAGAARRPFVGAVIMTHDVVPMTS